MLLVFQGAPPRPKRYVFEQSLLSQIFSKGTTPVRARHVRKRRGVFEPKERFETIRLLDHLNRSSFHTMHTFEGRKRLTQRQDYSPIALSLRHDDDWSADLLTVGTCLL